MSELEKQAAEYAKMAKDFQEAGDIVRALASAFLAAQLLQLSKLL